MLSIEDTRAFAAITGEQVERSRHGVGAEPKKSAIYVRREDVSPRVDALVAEARALGLAVECDRAVAHHH